MCAARKRKSSKQGDGDSPQEASNPAGKEPATGAGSPRRSLRWISATLALVVLGGILGRVAWRQLAPQIAAHSRFQLEPEDVHITPPPNWVRTDIKTDVLGADGLAGGSLSILDDQLLERLHTAFGLHPWVERVVRVRKQYPPSVDVKLVYRRPVLMVEVPGGLFPVDIYGVLLPSEDFSPVEADRYPRVAGVRSAPGGPVGCVWEDAAVLAAAQVASVLEPVWNTYQFEALHQLPPSSMDDKPTPSFFLTLRNARSRVIWGRVGSQLPVEPSDSEKLGRLKRFVAREGPLVDGQSVRDIDLRPTGSVAVIPRLARSTDDGS